MSMLRQLAIKWRERESALGYKGKRAENAAFEFFIGATAALQISGHPDADHVGTCAALILATAPFPLGTIDQWAKADLPEAQSASETDPAPGPRDAPERDMADDFSNLALLEDINACASDALEALAENRLDDVRFNLKALLDTVREEIDAIEQRPLA